MRFLTMVKSKEPCGQPPQAQEIQRRTHVFGNQLDQPVHEGGVDELTGAQIRQDPDREALGGERARVNVSEQNALGEVKRPHRDRGIRMPGRRRG